MPLSEAVNLTHQRGKAAEPLGFFQRIVPVAFETISLYLIHTFSA